MKLYKNVLYLLFIAISFTHYGIQSMTNPLKRMRPLNAGTVDLLAAKYVPVLNKDNTVNMDWIRETIMILGQQGVTVDISNENNIKSVANALWSSSIFQTAMTAQINQFRGNKTELRQRFWESLLRSLDIINKENITRMRGRLAEGLDSPAVGYIQPGSQASGLGRRLAEGLNAPSVVTPQQLQQMKIAREAQERANQRAGLGKRLAEGLDAPSVVTPQQLEQMKRARQGYRR